VDAREVAVTARLRAAGCVFAEEEAALLIQAAAGADLERLVVRREAGEPLEVILGWVDFGGLRLHLCRGVFVPRQRSLALVAVALGTPDPPRRLLDLGCGSGALAAAVRRHLPDLEVWAVDVDPVAVACAALNLAEPGDRVLCGSWFEPVPAELGGTVDLIVANAPYVPSAALATMPPEARLHEPATALDGGDDGLDHHRVLIAQAPDWLAVGGRLLIEVGVDQVATGLALIAEAGLRGAAVRDEEREATVLIATRA
jgi:release factor glutamine methyltransferase